MTRFAWLQTRIPTLIAAGLLAALAVAAAITGIQLSHLYTSEVAHCHTGCSFAISQFLSHDSFMDRTFNILGRAVPALLGMFWGAPLLAREFETGAYRLAWTQSVSRSRWLITKLALGGLATVIIAGLFSLAITWWYRAYDHVEANPYGVFDRRDVAPIAYAVFAFASGALIGAVLRRTVPAMAATLGVFVLVRVGVSIWVRPHLQTPVNKTMSLLGAGPSASVQLGVGSRNGGALTLFASGEGPPKSWTLSTHLLTGSGQRLSSTQTSAFLHQYCPNVGHPPAAPPGHGAVAQVVGPNAGRACLDHVAKTFHLLVSYQPASRYWTFQWLEAGIFVVLAIAAAIGCYVWVTRRAN